MDKKKVTFAVGIVVALIGAGLMFDGQVLGDRTTGIATVVGIVGIVLIVTGGFRLLK